MDIEKLRVDYSKHERRAERLRLAMIEQLAKLLRDNDITLGVPMESRVKEWSSIAEKLDRKDLELDDIASLSDLVGLRMILLFREDLDRADKLIRDNFQILGSEDKAKLLGEAQFGYQSLHYQLKIPASWCNVPTMADLNDLQVELQVRTIAQHIWAAASHKLQYKHEASVPPPIKRTINRVSALLETIDLEFDRVLSERRSYLRTEVQSARGSEPLNVDILKSVLDELLPAENLGPEDYETLLLDLSDLSVVTVDELRSLILKHRSAALEKDKVEVKNSRPVRVPVFIKIGLRREFSIATPDLRALCLG